MCVSVVVSTGEGFSEDVKKGGKARGGSPAAGRAAAGRPLLPIVFASEEGDRCLQSQREEEAARDRPTC